LSVGIERLSGELVGANVTGRSGSNGPALREALNQWEDLLTLIVDPEHARVHSRARARRLLSFLLDRAGIDEPSFWRLSRGQRGRLFLSRWSRQSRDIPQLELTSFDLDKLIKERFRQEPLTIGSAWHYGFWRSYFSHAAITHPANDGLREEFSTAWDIVRKQPAVLFRTAAGDRQDPLASIRIDMPMIVGPLPHSDGHTLERAYLEAIAAADPAADLRTRSLVVIEAKHWEEHEEAFVPHARNVLMRIPATDDPADPRWVSALPACRIAELEWGPDLAARIDRARSVNPDLLLSVFLRYGDGFWQALEDTVRLDGVALVHYHAGPEKSYRLTPRIDAFLKARFLRARVQLVSAGGDSDTQASAATVYESVLLGANGGAMTHVATLALVPELIDSYHGADPAPVVSGLAGRDAQALREQALNTLTCWQHSILDFLSCMGIDDIQKTSGNTMAITMTEDWVREIDRLATPEFGDMNAELNRRRVRAEPVPGSVRAAYRVSALLVERRPDLPLVQAAKILAHENVNWHLENSNRSLSADFLEVIYRMAAGELPGEDDFFMASDMGAHSLDAVGLRLSRESLRWSLERLRRNPALLDYVSLAVPRGFDRPGSVAPGARVEIRARVDDAPLAVFEADVTGGFEHVLPAGHPIEAALEGDAPLLLSASGSEGGTVSLTLARNEGFARSLVRVSAAGGVLVKCDPRGGVVIAGYGFREPIWHAPVSHASISLGAASEEFLIARIEGNAGLAMTSSGEGGPIRLEREADMRWESMQAASGHFGIHGADLRRVRDVEIKINQGAKPGKGGRLSGAKVTPTVSRARNIPVGTDALSPDPKHDIYSIEDMPAEVWLWLLFQNHCGIKITGSNYTRYVAAGMWSNFVVDYLLVDSGLGGSGNYHADSSHVGWPDIFRTILHTHHALVNEKVDLERTGELKPIRDLNGATDTRPGVPRTKGGTRLFASGGLRGELDMLKVLIAGADGLVEASIGKAVAFGCNQCGNCHLDCPRGGITTKPELTIQNDRALMRQRFRNWTVLNMVKLAVLIDALNRESGALEADGRVAQPDRLIDDIRLLRGRTDLLVMPDHGPARALRDAGAGAEAGAHGGPTSGGTPADAPHSGAPTGSPGGAQAEHDSCRVGSLAVSEPVTGHAIWEAARLSYNGGNNRGGGIDFAGFAPAAVRERTCIVFNTIGPDRSDTMREMVMHLTGCRFFDAAGEELSIVDVQDRLDAFRFPICDTHATEDGWRAADLRENPGDFYMLFVDLKAELWRRYGRALIESPHWLQRHTKYGDLADDLLVRALEYPEAIAAGEALAETDAAKSARLTGFVADVREEYFTALAHVLDSRYYRTHGPDPESGRTLPPGKYAAKRRGYVVSIGQDLAAIKISGWTHTIPRYFDFDRFWARYPGAAERGGVETRQLGRTFVTPALYAHVWGMHHRYPTNSPAIDAEGRGNPAGAHPFKAYNVLLMHNGEQVAVDSTSPFLGEFGFVHADPSMGEGHADYHGDSVYERKALTDTEYAAYLVDFTRRVLGLDTEEASQIISPITGFDLDHMDEARREKLRLLMTNYVQLTPTGPYKFTIVESRPPRDLHLGDPAPESVVAALTPGFAAAPSAQGDGADTNESGTAPVGQGPPGVPGQRVVRATGRIVGFRENMDIKFLRPHEIIVTRDTAPGGVTAVANGSEAKIADSMLRVLHQQGVLGDAGADLRFNMRPGGNPGQRDFGGVFEAFTAPGAAGLELVNRFGEVVGVHRAGTKVALVATRDHDVDAAWRDVVSRHREALVEALESDGRSAARLFGPDAPLPAAAEALIEGTLARAVSLSFADYRHLVEWTLPDFAATGDAARALALRVLTELRKRLAFADLGGKSLSSMEYLTDGGRAADGSAEGGIYRVLDAVPDLFDALSMTAGDAGHYARLTLATRDDLAAPIDAARDVLVIDLRGFESESFGLDSASRIVSAAVRKGWRHLIGYDFTGGPRYVGTNLANPDGQPSRGVTIELYGREFGDFIGALLEGASIWVYGQGQSHLGMKADSGELFVLQDILNTGMYAAHGGTVSVWDSGSRFAVAGQNKVALADGSPAPGFKSIHFGSPNEYAFEYLMSGGENSLHVVMGLRKPNAKGELALRPRPYAGKFFMSGAAAGRVFVFDPWVRLDRAQYRGNVLSAIAPEEWANEVAPLIEREAQRRGAPIRIEGDHITIRLDGEWYRWHHEEAFAKLIPLKVARAMQEQGVVPLPLVQMVAE